MTLASENSGYRRSFWRWIGRGFGMLYVLFSLLFGPIKSLAAQLARLRPIRRYQRWLSACPPACGLIVSLSSLGLLELSKILVLLTLQRAGLLAAALVTLLAKASVGYFAHLTWRAVRPQVTGAYPRVARADRWIEAQLAKLRSFRDGWVRFVKRQPWYLGLSKTVAALKKWLA